MRTHPLATVCAASFFGAMAGVGVLTFTSLVAQRKQVDELVLVVTPEGLVERSWRPSLATRTIAYADVAELHFSRSGRTVYLVYQDGRKQEWSLALSSPRVSQRQLGHVIMSGYVQFRDAGTPRSDARDDIRLGHDAVHIVMVHDCES
jgi:hypothetical protein